MTNDEQTKELELIKKALDESLKREVIYARIIADKRKDIEILTDKIKEYESRKSKFNV